MDVDIVYTTRLFVSLVVGSVLALVTYFLWKRVINNPRFWPELRFRLVFGFWPREREKSDPRLAGGFQSLVDRQLVVYAEEFLDLCHEEEGLCRKINGLNWAMDDLTLSLLRETNRRLRDIRRRWLPYYKKRFWSAYSLVKRFGFAVKPKVGDYYDKLLPDWARLFGEQGDLDLAS